MVSPDAATIIPFPKCATLTLFLLCLLAQAVLAGKAAAQSAAEAGWPMYGNNPGGTRYSPAKQIDRGNVAQLKVAWTHRTGALPHDEELDRKAAFEATPMTYSIGGKHYVVIAAGGPGKLGTKQGDYVIAFTLP